MLRRCKVKNVKVERAILNNGNGEDSFSIIVRGINASQNDGEIKAALRDAYPSSPDAVFQRLIDETRVLVR